MVNKGMNVGDVFEDGGLFYVVDEIVGSGYISHNISAEEKQALESKQAELEEPESQAAPETPGETETIPHGIIWPGCRMRRMKGC